VFRRAGLVLVRLEDDAVVCPGGAI